MNNGNMQKRMILALIFSIVLLVVFQYFFGPNQPDQQQQTTQPQKQTEKVAQSRDQQEKSQKPSKTSEEIENFNKQTENLEEEGINALLKKEPNRAVGYKVYSNKIYDIKIDKQGGRINSWKEKKRGIQILNSENFSLVYKELTDKNLIYKYQEIPNGFKLTFDNGQYYVIKKFIFSREEPHLVDIDVDSNIPFEKIVLSKKALEKRTQQGYDSYFYYSIEDKFEDDKIKKDEKKQISSRRFIGFDSKYFIASFLSKGYELNAEIVQNQYEEIKILLNLEKMPISFFYGPKSLDLLDKIDPALEDTIHFRGFLSPISKFLLGILKIIYSVIHNYGLAIIILTVAIKLLLYPLTHKSLTSMAKMKKIQPQIQKLRKKYKDEPKKMNQKMMDLYSEHNVNPAGGCLPMLLQFPILIALFSVFSNAIELKGQPFFLWINDLSTPDTLFHLPFDIPIIGNEFNLLPILMVVAMIYQQKMNAGGASSKGGGQVFMKIFLPAFMFVIFYNFPSGLVLYFLTNTVITLLQQKFIFSHLNNEEETS
ncbi:MAG: membrane protein insertase YidC [Candidatus Mcinerneyibacterium aminivorans]|uniref:Membrane protein insertase YidC n=1 Tax=Candidatus Mcinerneyibacterium aminivorans TaxID=2703815 RepID=A0A5D0MJU5_9BACT|nr:MAG: membrane protein insertase YidC [Candidatus Mcinerneyibacterium aminivorans]